MEQPITTKNVGQPCVICGQAADAQATIAALQARVQELEEWKHIVTGAGTDQESVIRLAAYEYTKIAVQCWKEANAKLESQLTQRTAELEAIETILDIDSGKTTVDKVRDLHRAFKQVWESYQDASNEMFKAQAELERVRAERAEYLENLGLCKGNELAAELDTLKGLIAALPKVEGDFDVVARYRNENGSVHLNDEVKALLKHRQGMEG